MAVLTVKGLQRQKEILAAADELFREYGYENTTLRMIAQEVGISCGHLEHYFKEKKDLLNALAELMIKNLWDIGTEVCRELGEDSYIRYAFAVHLLFQICSYLPDIKKITLEYVKHHDNQLDFSGLFGEQFLKRFGDEPVDDTAAARIRTAVNMAFAAQICCVQLIDDESFTSEVANRTSADHIRILFLLLKKDLDEAERISKAVSEKIKEFTTARLAVPFTKTYRWYVIEENNFRI